MTCYLSLTRTWQQPICKAVWVTQHSLLSPLLAGLNVDKRDKGRSDFFMTVVHVSMLWDYRMLTLISVSRVAKCRCGTLGSSRPGTQSTKHQLIPSYERRPVMEFGASLGGLWEQAGAEPFVLRADYQEATSRCSAPEEKQALFAWVVWDKSTPHTFLISVISFV